jgi:hypothetical protein
MKLFEETLQGRTLDISAREALLPNASRISVVANPISSAEIAWGRFS